MGRLWICFLLLGSLLSPAAEKRKSAKLPDIEIVEASAHRVEDDVALDGRIRNSGEKTIEGVVLLFDFMAVSNQVIVTKKFPIDKETLAPGEEAEFHVRMADPVRAVRFRMNSTDRQERDLRIVKNGPFPIE